MKFFEFGNCYYFHEENKCPDIIPGVSSSRDPEVIKHVLDAYSEDYHLGLWVTGKRVSGSWIHADEESSCYELKAYVLNVLTRLGVNFGALVFAPSDNDIYSKASRGQWINEKLDKGHILRKTLPTIWLFSTQPITLLRLSMEVARWSPSTK